MEITLNTTMKMLAALATLAEHLQTATTVPAKIDSDDPRAQETYECEADMFCEARAEIEQHAETIFELEELFTAAATVIRQDRETMKRFPPQPTGLPVAKGGVPLSFTVQQQTPSWAV